MHKNKVEVVRMTPDMARAILKNNPNNRNVKRDRVSLYASDMEKGRWQLNGESIVIDANGNRLGVGETGELVVMGTDLWR